MYWYRLITTALNPPTMLAAELFNDEWRRLLSTVNRMRETLHDKKLHLPRIVIFSDQFVDRSWVLEALSGIQLPHAQSICRRCPLELRLKSTNANEHAILRSKAGPHNAETIINDLQDIASEVTRLTNVSCEPICLMVYKRDLPYDLTFIDLPVQTEDTRDQIKTVIGKYIEPRTAIVIHVIPSSVDFTIAESMQLAQEIGAASERQLIVVSQYDTSVDTLEPQCDCVDVLNRSEEEMPQRERQSFANECVGVDQLVKKLALIQQARVRSTLLETIEKLRERIRLRQQDLQTIPMALVTEHDCWTQFQSMINRFRELIHGRVNGDYDYRTPPKAVNQDTTDDRIAYRLHQLQQLLQRATKSQFSDYLSSNFKKRVVDAMKNAAGISLPNSPNFRIIEHLFRQDLGKLPHLCKVYQNDARKCMRESLLKLLDQVFEKSYPGLLQPLREVIVDEMNAAEARVDERIKEAIEMEYRLFTVNDEYTINVNTLMKSERLVLLPSIASADQLESSVARAALDIQVALESYCQIVQKRFVDHIAQVCYHQFITRSALVIDQKLTLAIKPADLVRLMREPLERTTRRETLTRSIKACEEALQLGQECV